MNVQIEPSATLIPVDESLAQLADATDHLQENLTLENAQEAANAARLAWADLYSLILFAGRRSEKVASGLKGLLLEINFALERVSFRDPESENLRAAYQAQTSLYLHLIDLADQHGRRAVAQALQGIFEDMQKLSPEDMVTTPQRESGTVRVRLKKTVKPGPTMADDPYA